jgi:Family of unknown function (DUF5906)
MDAMIKKSLANNDAEAYDYIRRWVAWTFQNPTKRAEACLVLRSECQGTGKGLLGNSVCKIFGTHAVHLARTDSLTAKFNSQLALCAFLFDDESTFSGDSKAASAMKALVTEPTLDIEKKHLDVITLTNSLKIMKATNSAWAVPVEASDRRYAIFESSDEYANDQKYFGPIIRELEHGGLSAMLYDLLHWDLQGWHPRNSLPKNEAKATQQMLSLKPELQWLLGFLESGVLPYTDATNHNRVTSPRALYDLARKPMGPLRYWSDVQFSKFLDDWGNPVKRANGAYRHFGSLATLRAEWLKRYPWYTGFRDMSQDWGNEAGDYFGREDDE